MQPGCLEIDISSVKWLEDSRFKILVSRVPDPTGHKGDFKKEMRLCVARDENKSAINKAS